MATVVVIIILIIIIIIITIILTLVIIIIIILIIRMLITRLCLLGIGRIFGIVIKRKMSLGTKSAKSQGDLLFSCKTSSAIFSCTRISNGNDNDNDSGNDNDNDGLWCCKERGCQ